MIYIITDNEYLYSGLAVLFRQHNLSLSRLPVSDISMIRNGDVVLISRPLEEYQIRSLSHICQAGGRAYFFVHRGAEGLFSGQSIYIDITTRPDVLIKSLLTRIRSLRNTPTSLFRIRSVKPREYLIAYLLLAGHCDTSVSEILAISRRTSRNYISHLLIKLGWRSVADIYRHRNIIFAGYSVISDAGKLRFSAPVSTPA